MRTLREELACRIRGRVLENEPMSSHTTFSIGGEADLWAEPADSDDVSKVLDFALSKGLARAVFGNGSNCLVLDAGFRGIVISTGGLNGVRRVGDVLFAGGGQSLRKLLGASVKMGLAGLEFSAGIPATVGGAVATNAGGRFGAMSALVRTVRAVSRAGVSVVGAERLGFAYRRSGIKSSDSIIVEAVLKLTASDPTAVRQRVAEIFSYRMDTQPLGFKSAGCIFRNPAEMSAGVMISSAGLGGRSIGGAEISQKHANFIVNRGGAAAADVLGLIKLIEEEIYRIYKIRLEREIEIIGA